MRIKSTDWLFITGKANSGKTWWVRAHAKVVPAGRLYILDFNRNDYQDMKTSAQVWDYEGGGQQECEDCINTIYAIGNCFSIFDEADNYFRNKTPSTTRFCTTARNRGIGAMVIGKRPMAVHPDYRTRFNYLVLFQNNSPDDIEYLEKWAATGAGSLEILRTLEQGQHIIVDLDKGEISSVKRI